MGSWRGYLHPYLEISFICKFGCSIESEAQEKLDEDVSERCLRFSIVDVNILLDFRSGFSKYDIKEEGLKIAFHRQHQRNSALHKFSNFNLKPLHRNEANCSHNFD